MAQKTDLNVTPYYDDFSEADQYHRVLFRPGYAVQARELTQLQTILQNQIERFGKHIFQEGSIVIPGGVTYDSQYFAVKLQATITVSSTTYSVADYLSQFIGTVIEGGTSGVKARVVGVDVATSIDPATLYVKWLSSGTDNISTQFSNGEFLSSESVISTFAIDATSAQLQLSDAVATGSAASVQEGVFFIRGMFIRAAAQSIILSKYTNSPSYRVGFDITETLVAPEQVSNLLDNAQGASNYAAKGAHRLQETLTLIKKGLTETDDADFTELIRVENGLVRKIVNKTEYSIVEEMLARRTFEESGNYTIKTHKIDPKEHLNTGTNRGTYLATEDPIGDETKLVMAVGPGKAIINGSEVETISTNYIAVNKARDTGSKNNASLIAQLGRWVKVTNSYNMPDVDGGEASVNWFKEVKLYDQQTGSAGRGSTSGAPVGLAKVKAFNYDSGVVGTASIYKTYLFDVNMYQLVTMSGVVSLTDDVVITGVTSGATAIMNAAVGAGVNLILQQVKGTFVIGEAITSSKSGDDTTTGSPIISTIAKKIFNRDVKSLFMTQTAGAAKDFTADISLDQSFSLNGTVSNSPTAGAVNTISVTAGGSGYTSVPTVSFTGGGASTSATATATVTAGAVSGVTITNGGQGYTSVPTVVFTGGGGTLAAATATIDGELPVNLNGLNTVFTEELVIGDIVSLPSGALGVAEERRVTAVTSNTLATLASAGTNTVTGITGTRKRGKMQELSKSSFLHYMPKENTATVTDVSFTVKRQFVGTTSALGAVTFTVGVGETFPSFTKKNYVLSVMTAGSGTAAVGDMIDIEGKTSSTTNSLTITDNTLFGNAAQVKLVAPVNVPTATPKTKSAFVMQQKTIADTIATNDYYGARIVDKEVSIDVADVYKLRAVFDSGLSSVVPLPPTLTVSLVSGTFTPGEIIIGSSSGAKGYVIVNSPATTVTYIKISGTFNTLDTITGQTSTVTAKVDAIAAGHTNITDHYTLDTGQRAEYYDISRIVRKAGVIAPAGQLLVIYDYFTHGTGDYFSVGSYGINYADIPKFNPELRDALDFRPRVADITSTTVNPFSIQNRSYETAGSSVGNIVQADDNILMDYTFYLPRNDLLYLNNAGEFRVLEGVSAENPQYPEQPKNTLILAKLIMNAYTFHDRDLYILLQKNRGYTMADIGKLETRIKNLEYYTSLNMLEQDTKAFEIQDQNGFNRYKNGFVVDNFQFSGSVGNINHTDHQVSIGNLHLFPPFYENQVKLLEENTTDDARKADNYQSTGKVVSLPYTDVPLVTQAKASTVEMINPFAVANWIGKITWDDGEIYTWARSDYTKYDTKYIEDTTAFEKAKVDAGGSGAGYEVTSGSVTSAGAAGEVTERAFDKSVTIRYRDPYDIGWTRYWDKGVVDAEIVKDELHPDYDPAGEIVDWDPDPWIKGSELGFTAKGFKPHTKLWPFFDEIAVSAYVKPRGVSEVDTVIGADLAKTGTTLTVTTTAGFPTSGTIKITDGTLIEQIIYTSKTGTTFTGLQRGVNDTSARSWLLSSAATVSSGAYGMPMISDSKGDLDGVFDLPETPTLKFTTGMKSFKLSDDENNLSGGRLAHVTSSTIPEPGTFGSAMLEAKGRINHWREVHLRVWKGTFRWETYRTWGIPRPNPTHSDPLAQTFFVELDATEGEGCYITKCDLYLQSKATSSDVKIPVSVEIVNVENGYPLAQNGIPNALAWKDQEDINISDDASVATSFVFPQPIFVQRRGEYAIVVRCDSPDYKLWIARMGQMDLGGKSMISEQAAGGSLFKSQNAHTWSPSQLEDLTFILYRAKFDTSVTGSFTTHNTALDSTTSIPEGIVTLDQNPITLTNASRDVRFRFKMPGVPRTEPHGMYSTTDNVIISGVESEISATTLNETLSAVDTTITVTDASNFPASGTIKIEDEVITYAGISTNDLTGCTRGTSDGTALTVAVAHATAEPVALYMLAGIPLTEINKTHIAISGIEDDSFLITVNALYPATSALIGGGSKVKVTRNIIMDIITPFFHAESRANTTLTFKAQPTTARSPNGPSTQNAFVPTNLSDALPITNALPYLFDSSMMIASQINETNEMAGAKSLKVVATLKSTKDTLSPMIDTKLMMLETVQNRLNKIDSAADVSTGIVYNSSIAASGDNNKAIYITKKITLASASTALRVMFAANIPSTSEVVVLYKILPDGSTEVFDDLGWNYFNTTGVDDNLSGTTDNQIEWKDYIYTAGVKDSGTGIALDDFTSFAIKIVMKGTNTAKPPRIKQFRMIALAA